MVPERFPEHIIRQYLYDHKFIIYRNFINTNIWEKLLVFDDIVKHKDSEFEIILSDCQTYFEIVETEQITSEDEIFEQDNDYLSDDEDYLLNI